MAGRYWFETESVPQPSMATVAYSIDASNAVADGASISTSRAYDVTDPDSESDVSGTILSGSATISTTTITTPLITSLTADKRYRLEIDVTDSGQTITIVTAIMCPY